MIICYQYNCMELVEDRRSETHYPVVVGDSLDWEKLFARLTTGSGPFSVVCGEGFLRGLLDYVKRNYIYVKAAGGIVKNPDGELLMMRRNDRFDLPKGKVESGETLAQAALRETEEETGLSNLTTGPLLLKTYHIYNLYGGWHFKQTSWFEMQHNGDQVLVPQMEEGITEVGWFRLEEWREKLEGSYATMQIIIGQVADN